MKPGDFAAILRDVGLDHLLTDTDPPELVTRVATLPAGEPDDTGTVQLEGTR